MNKKTGYIDIHCHIEACGEIEGVIAKARKARVGKIIANGVNKETNRSVLSFSRNYPEVKAALGLYPLDALKMKDSEINGEVEFIRSQKDKIVAIGEVGMDFKEDEKEHERQKKIFSQIISLSIEIDRPLIVHSRKAELECIELLEKAGAKKVIMHCFSGNFNLVERIKNNGWFITIPTSVTRSEHFQKIAEIFPINKIFCETDAPYLHPKKEWPNEPAFVIESYKELASRKKISLGEAAEQIENNYSLLF